MGNVRVGWGWVMHEWGGVGHAQGWFGWGVVCNVAVGWGWLCKGGCGLYSGGVGCEKFH